MAFWWRLVAPRAGALVLACGVAEFAVFVQLRAYLIWTCIQVERSSNKSSLCLLSVQLFVH